MSRHCLDIWRKFPSHKHILMLTLIKTHSLRLNEVFYGTYIVTLNFNQLFKIIVRGDGDGKKE